eukprot:scaffold65736_cov48-Phaeocystis_antarctica.AAC.1
MRCGARHPSRQAGGGGRRRRMQRAGDGATADSGQGTGRRAHVEHAFHGRDAGGIPAGDVLIEVIQAIKEVAHVGDGRDVPVGDGAVRRNGGGRVGVVRIDRRLQVGRAREDVIRRLRR